jgi:hypothetical protein
LKEHVRKSESDIIKELKNLVKTKISGYAVPQRFLIITNLLSVIVFASILDLSTLKGVMYLNIAVGLISLLQTSLFSIYKIYEDI